MRIVSYALFLILASPFALLLIYMVTGILNTPEALYYFTTDSFLHSVGHSMALSAVASLLTLLFGIPIALAFYTISRVYLQHIYLFVLLLLFMIQPIILLPVFEELTLFGNISAFWQSVTITFFHLFPLASIIWIYLFSRINYNALYASLSISSPWYTVKHIVFPQLRRRIPLLFLFLFLLVFIDQAVPSILGYRTYMEDLLGQMTLMEKMSSITLTALPSYLLVGLTTWYVVGLLKYKEEDQNQTSQEIYARTSMPGLGALVILIAIVVGMIVVLWHSCQNGSFAILFDENSIIIVQSIGLALVVSIVAFIVAILLRNGLKKYASKNISLFITVILFFYLLIPHSLVSLSLLEIYQWIGLFSITGDYLVFFIGHIFLLLPVATILLYFFERAKREDYFFLFSPVRKQDFWVKIIVPSYWIQWITILCILTVTALNELDVSILLIPPGFETTVVRIYNLLHYGDKNTIAFLSLAQLFFVILCFIFLSSISKKAAK